MKFKKYKKQTNKLKYTKQETQKNYYGTVLKFFF
jgi:hypothetical protein